jgi:hypothetical protein
MWATICLPGRAGKRAGGQWFSALYLVGGLDGLDRLFLSCNLRIDLGIDRKVDKFSGPHTRWDVASNRLLDAFDIVVLCTACCSKGPFSIASRQQTLNSRPSEPAESHRPTRRRKEFLRNPATRKGDDDKDTALAFEFDPIGVVDDTSQDGIGERRIVDDLVQRSIYHHGLAGKALAALAEMEERCQTARR